MKFLFRKFQTKVVVAGDIHKRLWMPIAALIRLEAIFCYEILQDRVATYRNIFHELFNKHKFEVH